MASSSKNIFITGATHGIGKAVSEYFCKNGWTVYGIASNREDNRGQEMMSLMPNFHYKCCDITDEKAVSQVLSEIPLLDAAFNNAGIGIAPKKLDKADINEAKRVIDVNLIGTLISIKHELQHMKKGVIINNSSISAFKAKTGADISYVASKAGIVALTRELSADTQYADKISFFVTTPGYIPTRMTATDDLTSITQSLPLGRPQTLNEVAELIYNIVVNYHAFNSGQCFQLNAGAFLL